MKNKHTLKNILGRCSDPSKGGLSPSKGWGDYKVDRSHPLFNNPTDYFTFGAVVTAAELNNLLDAFNIKTTKCN